MLLPILYWVILILAVIGVFVPPTAYPSFRYINGIVIIVLFVIIGLKIFKTPLT